MASIERDVAQNDINYAMRFLLKAITLGVPQAGFYMVLVKITVMKM